ncbi:MAG: hypothetical protein ACTFAL_08945 [Candidatus Electronema sp. V4]|uniref:hypothetical protein n=1 Tax=Candidatus Electronema sp. V4 TaxID=3454756 RepID=UPI0040556DCC
MHDLDHGRAEAEAEFEQWEAEGGQLEADEFEFEDAELYEAEAESLFCKNGEMCEAQETELALELLEVSSEEELEEFLGNLARRAVQAGRSILATPDMQAVGGILKGAARKALPHIGRAVGGHFGGATGKLFGLELEGLSGEDQEFEMAKGFVRFAGNTVRNMSGMAGSADPLAAAKQAASAAARVYAPGLLTAGKTRTVGGPSSAPLPSASGQSGRLAAPGQQDRSLRGLTRPPCSSPCKGCSIRRRGRC